MDSALNIRLILWYPWMRSSNGLVVALLPIFALNSHSLRHRKEYQMDGTNGLKETTLSVNVFTAPGKAMVGERPRPFGEALGFDPITSTLIFGEYDAVLVDAMGTVAEAEALADWVALHNRNLETIYITHPITLGKIRKGTGFGPQLLEIPE